MYSPDVLERAKEFQLSPDLVFKLYNGDPVKLTYMWVKQGHIDFKTFNKLLRYISES
jgi:hypothetical protein